MERENRVSLHKKQERVHVGEGIPSVHELVDGVPVFRRVSGRVIEYIRIGQSLFESVFGKVTVSKAPVDVVGFADDGYLKFDNGLIMQWGQESIGDTSVDVTFPIEFPTACLNVVGTAYRSNQTGGLTNALAIKTLPTTTLVVFNTATVWDTLFWQAIGH